MKKLSEQLRAHNKTESSSGPLGLGSDLNQILSSFLERSGTGHGKGSRFQHAEKLQFAKVIKIIICNSNFIYPFLPPCLPSFPSLFASTHFCLPLLVPHSQEEDAPVAVEATSEEDLQRQREEELTSLRQQLDEWSSKYEKLELDIKKYTAGK